MIRFFARIWAKKKYVWRLEVEAATAELSALLSANRAAEKRALAEQLNKEADAIEQNIKTEEATPEYQALEGQEKYEADREKREAEKIVESKRQQAAQESKAVTDGEATAQHFRARANNSRVVADKIRAV
jgi:hypothetical protein